MNAGRRQLPQTETAGERLQRKFILVQQPFDTKDNEKVKLKEPRRNKLPEVSLSQLRV